MQKCIYTFLFILFVQVVAFTQQDEGYIMRFPDVSKDKIVFVHGGNLWVVNNTGGQASMLSSAPGSEAFPRFSPDGMTIAFSANYSGNTDIYTIGVNGGPVKRVTYHRSFERVQDWSKDGNKLLFSSPRNTGRARFSQFYLIDKDGGLPEQLPIKQGEVGTFSPDGTHLAMTDRSRLFRTWKRYRGGSAPDIYLYNMTTMQSENITNSSANDELPMWSDNKVYYQSDAGPNMRQNIWVYDLETKEHRQITNFTDHDIQFPSLGPEEIVFSLANELYLLDLKTEKWKAVPVQLMYDYPFESSELVNVKDYTASIGMSPGGERAVVEARGEVFSLPAKEGHVSNLTQKSGSAERFPAWSPNGSKIAWWSDESGEYELVIFDVKTKTEKTVSSLGKGFRYHLYWSPDSKKVGFIDQRMMIGYFDLSTNTYKEVDQAKYKMHGGLMGFSLSWSPDSKWFTYSRSVGGRFEAIFLYSLDQRKVHQVTSGFYNDNDPVFDLKGEYLYLLTDRYLSPEYGNFDWSFIYPNSTQLAAIPLTDTVGGLLYAKNDTVALDIKNEEEELEEPEKKKGKKDKKKSDEEDDDESTEVEVKDIEILLTDMEYRMFLLPVKNGNLFGLLPADGKVVYNRFSNTGSAEGGITAYYFDIEEREEKKIMDQATVVEISKDGTKALVSGEGMNVGIIEISEAAEIKDALALSEMEMQLDVKAEWEQIFNDAWRIERDFFYDKDMHGLDWNEIRVRYGNLVKNATSRWDVDFILGEMIGEMNASHTYKGGGDMESAKTKNMGFLGVDWTVENGFYRIKDVIRGAPWDVEVRSPLDQQGIKAGNRYYVFSVNGRTLDPKQEPYAAFEGLAGKTVEIMAAKDPDPAKAKSYIVELMSSESRLRHLAWIESNRKMVEELSGGKVGYVYVPNTGREGQTELVRQFNGQAHKEALLIDERFNSGGQIPDRFVEILNRKPLAYWAVRDGQDWQWPPYGHFGPKAMLINGWSGSGGDAFPDYFKKAGLGPLIGAKTWGGLIGISGAPRLVDGGGVTVPTFRMYHPDGTWFDEGHGVEPDIHVPENPGELAKGNDAQIAKAVEWLIEEISENGYTKPGRPAKENRN